MEDWMTLSEASQVLRLAPDTLRRWIRQGKLHGRKLGRAWRVQRAEVEQLLREQSSEAPPGTSSTNA
jgi:excisionase family DNA binding protein